MGQGAEHALLASIVVHSVMIILGLFIMLAIFGMRLAVTIVVAMGKIFIARQLLVVIAIVIMIVRNQDNNGGGCDRDDHL